MCQLRIRQNNDEQITWFVSTIVYLTHIIMYMFI